MFYFFILAISLPLWAYEKKEVRQDQLPSSPIQVYESQEEKAAAQTKEQGRVFMPDNETASRTKKPDETPVQQNSPTTIIIREQPPVQVYSEPLTPQEKLSRARKQAEEHTENKIRTRLELLRLKDEKTRMDQLLSPLQDENVSVQQPQKSAPVQEVKAPRTHNYFFHVGPGYVNHYTKNSPYPKAIERMGTSWAVGLGLYESHKFSIEYTFNFSKHRVVYPPVNYQYDPRYTQFDLIIHSIALKYYILPGRIKPFVGLIGSFNAREYSTELEQFHRYNPIFYWDKRPSKSFQGGVVAGAEVLIGQNFVIGLDFRFSMNIHDLKDIGIAKEDHYYYYTAFQAQQPLPEDMQLYNLQGFFRILF